MSINSVAVVFVYVFGLATGLVLGFVVGVAVSHGRHMKQLQELTDAQRRYSTLVGEFNRQNGMLNDERKYKH